MPGRHATAADRFMRYVTTSNEGCWEFPEPTHAPPAPGERCAWRGVGTGTCGSVKEHPRHSHRGGDACEDESGECSRDFAYCHPFQPEPAP